MGTGSFLGVKRLERGVNHSLASSAELVDDTSTFPIYMGADKSLARLE